MVCCYQHCVNYSDGYLVGAGVQRGLKGCFYVIVFVGDYCSALDVMSGADFGVFLAVQAAEPSGVYWCLRCLWCLWCLSC